MNQHGTENHERNRAVLAMLEGGMSQGEVAKKLGVTKNTVSGIWSRANGYNRLPYAKTTMAERLDALHAKMDAVKAKYEGVGRVPNVPKALNPNRPRY